MLLPLLGAVLVVLYFTGENSVGGGGAALLLGVVALAAAGGTNPRARKPGAKVQGFLRSGLPIGADADAVFARGPVMLPLR